MQPNEICGLIKQKFFDIRKGYFNKRSPHDISKGAINVLNDHTSLFNILTPLSQSDLQWLLNTSPSVMVKQLSYLSPSNFLIVDIVTLQEQLKEQLADGAEVEMHRIADSTQWTFDVVNKTINTKADREKKPRRKK